MMLVLYRTWLITFVTVFVCANGDVIVPIICSGASWTTIGVTVAGSSAGTAGSSLSLLSGPQDFEVDINQTVYVADTSNHRIVSWLRGATSGTLVAGQTGTAGSTSTLLASPNGVKFSNNSIYVLDLSNARVQRWILGASSGTTVAGGNGAGSAVNQMSSSAFIFVDAATNIYVSDYANSRIAKWAPAASTSTIVAGNNGMGSGLNQFNAQWGIFVDTVSNLIYIADRINHRMVRWASGGSSGTVIAGSTGTTGNTATLLNNPGAVLFDSAGLMYVLDGSNYRVLRFVVGNTTGTTILSFSTGTAANQLSGSSFPFLMSFDTVGNIYLGDMANNRIQRYDISCPTTTTSTTSTTSTSTTSTTSTTTSTTTATTSTTSRTTSTSTSTSTTSITTTSSTSSTATTTTATTATTTTATTATTTISSDSQNSVLVPVLASVFSVLGAVGVGVGIALCVRYLKNRKVTPDKPTSNTDNSAQDEKPKRPPDYASQKSKVANLPLKPTKSQSIRIGVRVIP